MCCSVQNYFLLSVWGVISSFETREHHLGCGTNLKNIGDSGFPSLFLKEG